MSSPPGTVRSFPRSGTAELAFESGCRGILRGFRYSSDRTGEDFGIKVGIQFARRVPRFRTSGRAGLKFRLAGVRG